MDKSCYGVYRILGRTRRLKNLVGLGGRINGDLLESASVLKGVKTLRFLFLGPTMLLILAQT